MSFNRDFSIMRFIILPACLLVVASLSACLFQPLYDSSSGLSDKLFQVGVSRVDTRAAQQVRNHLLFLLHSGNDQPSPRYEVRLRVNTLEKQTLAQANLRDTTAGSVTVTAKYELIDTETRKTKSKGARSAMASFDRTSQIFANQRAVLEAENRAAKEVAEQLLLAIASDLRE